MNTQEIINTIRSEQPDDPRVFKGTPAQFFQKAADALERREKDQLIADLLATLESVTDKLDYICTYCDDGFVGDTEWNTIQQARAAIAKAKGA